MFSWILGILVVILAVTLVAMFKILKAVEKGSRHQHGRIIELQGQNGELHGKLMCAQQDAEATESLLAEAREALQDSKSRFGLVKKHLKNTVEALRGKNFRSKKESLEHSKPFKKLMEMLESL